LAQVTKVKINFILPFFSARPIGGFKVAYEYANHLARRGHTVSVIHPRFVRNTPIPNGLINKLRTFVTNTQNRAASRSGLKWQPLEKDVRILHVSEPTPDQVPNADVVFAMSWQTAEYVREYPSEKGKKCYIVMDFYPWIASKDELEKSWNWPLLKVTISGWLFDKVRKAGCPEADVVNIPIGINFDQFRLHNGLSDRGKKLTMLYSSSPSKGSNDGLEAIKICKEKHSDLQVTLFGPSMRLRPANIPSWAEYKGNVLQKTLTKILNDSRIYVCSSVAEGFALPPAEAMACGCAVAATDCGGIREFADDHINILLSPPGEPHELASNILRLLEDESLRLKLAKAGRETISRFTWDRATNSLERLISPAGESR